MTPSFLFTTLHAPIYLFSTLSLMRIITYTHHIYLLWAFMVLEGTWLLQLRLVSRCELRSASSNPLGDKVQAPGTAVPTHSK